jgi:prevent-host-death family protein
MDVKNPNVWKLQDAKARFSEVVRRARAGAPQEVTVHGQEAVVIFDPSRYELRAKVEKSRTMRDFLEGSRKFRGAAEGLDFDQPAYMDFPGRDYFGPRNNDDSEGTP